MNNDTFCRLAVTSAQCIIGTEKNSDAGIILNYGDDDYSQGFSQYKEIFSAWQKHDILQLDMFVKILDLQMLGLLNLNELLSSQNKAKELHLQDKLGHQNFLENIKNYLNQVLIQLKIPLKNNDVSF